MKEGEAMTREWRKWVGTDGAVGVWDMGGAVLVFDDIAAYLNALEARPVTRQDERWGWCEDCHRIVECKAVKP